MIGLIFLEPVEQKLVEEIFWCKLWTAHRDPLWIVLLDSNHYVEWFWYAQSVTIKGAIEHCKNKSIPFITLKVSSSSG